MIEVLSALASDLIVGDAENETYWFGILSPENKPLRKGLASLRFMETLQKYKASQLLDDILRKLPDGPLFDAKLEWEKRITKTTVSDATNRSSHEVVLGYEYGLTNKSPLAGLYVERSDPYLVLGVQIQNNQYRRYILADTFGIPKRETAARKFDGLNRLISKTDGYHWLFAPSSDVKKRIVPKVPVYGFDQGLGVRTTMSEKSPICSFAPGFVYQHIDIGVQAGSDSLPVSNLIPAILQDIEYAYGLLHQPEYYQRFKNVRYSSKPS